MAGIDGNNLNLKITSSIDYQIVSTTGKEEISIDRSIESLLAQIKTRLEKIGNDQGQSNKRLATFREVMVLQHLVRIINALAKDANVTSGLFAASSEQTSNTKIVFEGCNFEAKILLGKDFDYVTFFNLNPIQGGYGLGTLEELNFLVSHRELKSFRATFGLTTGSHTCILDIINKRMHACYDELATKEQKKKFGGSTSLISQNEDCLRNWENKTVDGLSRAGKLYAETIVIDLFRLPSSKATEYIKDRIYKPHTHLLRYKNSTATFKQADILKAINNMTEKEYNALFEMRNDTSYRLKNKVKQIFSTPLGGSASNTDKGVNVTTSDNSTGRTSTDSISQIHNGVRDGDFVGDGVFNIEGTGSLEYHRLGENVTPKISQQLFKSNNTQASEPPNPITWVKRNGVPLETDKVTKNRRFGIKFFSRVTSTTKTFADKISDIISQRQRFHGKPISTNFVRPYYGVGADSFLDDDVERFSFSRVNVLKDVNCIFKVKKVKVDDPEIANVDDPEIANQYLEYLQGVKRDDQNTLNIEEYLILTGIFDQQFQGIIKSYFSGISTLGTDFKDVTIDLTNKTISMRAKLTEKTPPTGGNNDNSNKDSTYITLKLAFAFKPLAGLGINVEGKARLNNDSLEELGKFNIDELFEFKIAEVTTLENEIKNKLTGFSGRSQRNKINNFNKIIDLLKFKNIPQVATRLKSELARNNQADDLQAIVDFPVLNVLALKKNAEYLIKLKLFQRYLLNEGNGLALVQYRDDSDDRINIQVAILLDGFVDYPKWKSYMEQDEHKQKMFNKIVDSCSLECSGIFLKELYKQNQLLNLGDYEFIFNLLSVIDPIADGVVEPTKQQAANDLLLYCIGQNFSPIFCLELAGKFKDKGILKENEVADMLVGLLKISDDLFKDSAQKIIALNGWENNVLSLHTLAESVLSEDKPAVEIGQQDLVNKNIIDNRLFHKYRDGLTIYPYSETDLEIYKDMFMGIATHYCNIRLSSSDKGSIGDLMNKFIQDTYPLITEEVRGKWNEAYSDMEEVIDFAGNENDDNDVIEGKLLFCCVKEVLSEIPKMINDRRLKDEDIDMDFANAAIHEQIKYGAIWALMKEIVSYREKLEKCNSKDEARKTLKLIVEPIASVIFNIGLPQIEEKPAVKRVIELFLTIPNLIQ